MDHHSLMIPSKSFGGFLMRSFVCTALALALAISSFAANPAGIPGRPWFKHILYGARFTYAHLELPGLTEAVERQDWPTAKQQAEILKDALDKNTKLLMDLSSTLEK